MMVLLAIWLPRTGRDWSYFNTVTSLGKIYIIQDDKLHDQMICWISSHFVAEVSISKEYGISEVTSVALPPCPWHRYASIR